MQKFDQIRRQFFKKAIQPVSFWKTDEEKKDTKKYGLSMTPKRGYHITLSWVSVII